jgi:hypothetical protein
LEQLASKVQSTAQALIGAIRLTVALSRPRIIPDPAVKVFNLTMVRLWRKWAERCLDVDGDLDSEWNIAVAPLRGATGIEDRHRVREG